MDNNFIYLIDDDQDILDSLSWMLQGCGYQTSCFNSALDFLNKVDLQQKGVVIVDLQMPAMTGLELQHCLVEKNSPLALIILTGHGSINTAVKAIKKGAVDFLEKPVDGEILQALIQKANTLSEEHYLRLQQQSILQERLATLTNREHQVMQHVLAGKMNKVIAFELAISQRTVEIHRNRVLQKMQVHNATELAALLSNISHEV